MPEIEDNSKIEVLTVMSEASSPTINKFFYKNTVIIDVLIETLETYFIMMDT